MLDKEKEEYLSKLHSAILLIMDEIDRICVEEQLTYYLVGGTLLGAIRHGGFIPWDDDFDIAMPREDYDKFLMACKENLHENFRLLCNEYDEEYVHLFAKIHDARTVFDENIKQNDCYAAGIFVDIFPLDLSSGYKRSLVLRKKAIDKILAIKWYRAHPENTGIIKSCIAKLIPVKLATNTVVRLCKHAGNGKSRHYTNFGSQYGIQRQTIPKEYYGKGKKIPFENRYYFAPDDPHNILLSIYGVNYMKIPPIEKRRTHYPRRVVFSDGSEYQFEKPEKTLSVLDTL